MKHLGDIKFFVFYLFLPKINPTFGANVRFAALVRKCII